MEIKIEPTTTEDTNLPVSIEAGKQMVMEPAGYNETPDVSNLGKKKRGRPRKKPIQDGANTEVIVAKDDPSNLPYIESNVPYAESYQQTNGILMDSIQQLNYVSAEVAKDIATIRESKTIRKKYDYISELTGTLVSAIQGKVSAAREINNSIKNSHELDLKRAKELKLTEQKDDAKTIMDMYQAFVSTPVSANMMGPFQHPLGASTIDLTIPSPQLQYTMMGQDPNVAYNNYVNNMSPSQMTMMIEENPNMKHVVAYDPATGNADFAVYDTQTGQFLQGVPTRDKEMFMPGITFDFAAMQAHSNDLNESYDIIYVNNPNNPTQEIITGNSSGPDFSNY